jgi:hypothetical protein
MSNQSRRLAPAQIAEDEEAFAALKAIANYAPANPAYSLAAIEQAYQDNAGRADGGGAGGRRREGRE